MKIVHLSKSPYTKGAIINLLSGLPTFPRQMDQDDWYKSQAQLLYDVLEEALPAGTFKQLSSIMRETP